MNVEQYLLVAIAAVVLVLLIINSPRLVWTIRYPFLWTNWLQWFTLAPIRFLWRDNSSEWSGRLFWILIPLGVVYGLIVYIITIPVRLLNALYFDILLFWSVSLRNGIEDLLRPKFDTSTWGQYTLRWIILFPWRFAILCFRYSWTLIQGFLMLLFDVLWPTLTLFHGTSRESANSIASSGKWYAGSGDWVGTGIYFGLTPRVAIHYARGHPGSPFILARVTLLACRPVATLSKELREKIGHWQGNSISRSVKFPWAALEHWRSDLGWYELCLIQKEKYETVTPWRVRPICIVENNIPDRLPGGLAVWPKTLMGIFLAVISLVLTISTVVGGFFYQPELITLTNNTVAQIEQQIQIVGLDLLQEPKPPMEVTSIPKPTRTKLPTRTPKPTEKPSIPPCAGTKMTRLSVRADSRVNVAWVNIRTDPRVSDPNNANVITKLPQGTKATVLSGPVCSQSGYWWQVKSESGTIGWIKEATSSHTLLVPID